MNEEGIVKDMDYRRWLEENWEVAEGEGVIAEVEM